nr:phosphate ABC transporter permease subunit PstC [Polyangium aurulentum]
MSAQPPPIPRAATPRAATSLADRIVPKILFLCALVSVLATAGIVAVLAIESAALFSSIGLSSFFLDTQWTPLFTDKHYGIWPLAAGTLLTTAIALAVALPLGLFAAIYLSEIASKRARRILKPTLEVLAGIPTVVYGYFALTMITPALQRVVPGLAAFNALSAGITMGMMILPLVASLSDDALFAVPQSLREGAYALGASQRATVFRVVLPTAISGVGAAAILAVSRAIGETMIVAVAAGQQPRLTLDPRVPIETMTAYIVQVSLGDTPSGSLEYRTLFAVGAALFVITLGLNILAQRMRGRLAGRTL